MYDIITLGSANVDIFVKTKTKPEVKKHDDHMDIAYHLGDKLLVDELQITTGGGGTNTAVAFSRLGLKTGCICAVGNDVNGKHILEELEMEKITFLGEVKDGNTGLSIILPSAKDRTILAYKGVNNFLKINDLNLQKINTKWIYVSSMLGQSFETAKKVIQLAKKKGTKIAMNFSLYSAKQGLPALSHIIGSADIIILNKEEAQALTNEDKISNIFNKIHEHSDAIVAITSGSGDIIASDGLSIYVKKIHPVNPVDKTGSGDAFAAGFVYGIIKNKDIQTSIDCGHKEALSVIGHIGAKNNLLRKM